MHGKELSWVCSGVFRDYSWNCVYKHKPIHLQAVVTGEVTVSFGYEDFECEDIKRKRREEALVDTESDVLIGLKTQKERNHFVPFAKPNLNLQTHLTPNLKLNL